MLALLATIMDSMLIFFSNKNVFPCPGCYFVLAGSTWRTRRGRAVVSPFSSTVMAIFLSCTYFTRCQPPPMPLCHSATLPLCQGAPTQRFFTRYLHLRALTTQRQVLAAVASLSADASRASNPPEYEHEQMFYLYKEQPVLASVFSALVGQPCRHMLLIIYSWCNCVQYCSITTICLFIHTYIHRYLDVDGGFQPTDRPTDGQTVSHRIY